MITREQAHDVFAGVTATLVGAGLLVGVTARKLGENLPKPDVEQARRLAAIRQTAAGISASERLRIGAVFHVATNGLPALQHPAALREAVKVLSTSEGNAAR